MRISDWSSDVCSSDLQRVGSLDETRDRSRLVSPIIIYAGQGGKNEARDMHGVRICIIVVVVHAREPLERRVRRSQDMELLAYHMRTNGEITPDERQQIGRAHVCTPVTNAHLVCRLLIEKKNKLPIYGHTL